jgi:hypothetical protein
MKPPFRDELHIFFDPHAFHDDSSTIALPVKETLAA